LPPQVRAQLDAELTLARRDVETVVTAAVPVIASPLRHCYLDVPYAEPSADPAQADRQGRVGLRLYTPQTVAESFGWAPADTLGPGREAQVGGVEAAIWAETISGFDDLSFLLLPAWPVSPTTLGAPRNSPAGLATATASPGTADCGPKTTSHTSVPLPWTGSELLGSPCPPGRVHQGQKRAQVSEPVSLRPPR
jgi:Glycosyl hydrolase family 20, catalytic domain